MERIQKSKRPIPWLSGGLAALLAFLIIAIIVPNLTIPVLDNSTSHHNHHVEWNWPALRHLFAFTLIPVLCIFTLGRRWIIFDWLAWIALLIQAPLVFR